MIKYIGMESAQERSGIRRKLKPRHAIQGAIGRELRQHAEEVVVDDVNHDGDKDDVNRPLEHYESPSTAHNIAAVLHTLQRDTLHKDNRHAQSLRKAAELLERLRLPQGADILPALREAAANAFQQNVFYHPESAAALIEPFNLSPDFVQSTKLAVVRKQLSARLGDLRAAKERGIDPKPLDLQSFLRCCQELGLSEEHLMEIAADEYQKWVLHDLLTPNNHHDQDLEDPLLMEMYRLDHPLPSEELRAAKVRLVERLLTDGRSEDAVQLILHRSMLSADDKKTLEHTIRQTVAEIHGQPDQTKHLTRFMDDVLFGTL